MPQPKLAFVMAGAILGVVADSEDGYAGGKVPEVIQQTIEFGLETVRILGLQELMG